jgi:hypothetical protein
MNYDVQIVLDGDDRDLAGDTLLCHRQLWRGRTRASTRSTDSAPSTGEYVTRPPSQYHHAHTAASSASSRDWSATRHPRTRRWCIPGSCLLPRSPGTSASPESQAGREFRRIVPVNSLLRRPGARTGLSARMQTRLLTGGIATGVEARRRAPRNGAREGAFSYPAWACADYDVGWRHPVSRVSYAVTAHGPLDDVTGAFGALCKAKQIDQGATDTATARTRKPGSAGPATDLGDQCQSTSDPGRRGRAPGCGRSGTAGWPQPGRRQFDVTVRHFPDPPRRFACR